MHTSEHFGKGGSYALNPETDRIELAERIQIHPEIDSWSSAGDPALAGLEPVAEAAADKPGKRGKKSEIDTTEGAPA